MPELTQESITRAVDTSKSKHGKIVLSDIQEELGISRGKARALEKDGFILMAHGNLGRKRYSKLDDFEELIKDEFLRRGIKNSDVIYQHILDLGFAGKPTIVKDFIRANAGLIPERRRSEALPNRTKRYETDAGRMFQMDWGFIKISDQDSGEWQCACFAMICHHCGNRYVEFFPSARQENLFVGMMHAFMAMGIPEIVYTDNMKSVVIRRDCDGNPIWNHDYDLFQKTIGFETKLAKVAHPWSKGAVERLVRYVKDNFIPGRRFYNISDMNSQASAWCGQKNQKENPSRGHVPAKEHAKESLQPFVLTPEAKEYLYPLRKISIDGFVSIDGRQFGVPYSFSGQTVRVSRDGDRLTLRNLLTYDVIYTHPVDWSKRPKIAIGQWGVEEKPTAPVTAVARMEKNETSISKNRLRRFAITEGGKHDQQ
ncbi:IS21 family transposase [Merdimonas faecis]